MNRMTKAKSIIFMPEKFDTGEKLERRLMESRVVHPTSEERKQEIMNLLHEFNDVKDAAQIVIGALANLEGKTIKEMHMYYNLPTTE